MSSKARSRDTRFLLYSISVSMLPAAQHLYSAPERQSKAVRKPDRGQLRRGARAELGENGTPPCGHLRTVRENGRERLKPRPTRMVVRPYDTLLETLRFSETTGESAQDAHPDAPQSDTSDAGTVVSGPCP